MSGDDTGKSGATYKFKKLKDAPEWPKGAHTGGRDPAGRYVQTFDTLQDALEASRFCNKENRQLWADYDLGNNHALLRRGALHWYGVDSLAAVRTAIRDGWPEGVAKMRAALDDIGATLQPHNVRRVRRWTDFGDSVEMSRVWAGRCDAAWQQCRRLQRPAVQNVTIAANITALAAVNSQELFWRGAAVLKLADMLTEYGYNVRIDAIRQSDNAYANGLDIIQRVTVKEYTAPLELNSLAATVCLAGFFRLVLFQCQLAGHHKGHPLMGQSSIYKSTTGEIDGVERCTSAQAARDWINEALAKIEGGQAIAA